MFFQLTIVLRNIYQTFGHAQTPSVLRWLDIGDTMYRTKTTDYRIQTSDLRHGCQCCFQCCMSCHTWGVIVDWGGQAKGDPETHSRMGMSILWGAEAGVWTVRVQHNLVCMNSDGLATGHMYVGGTVLKRLITLITMVRALTRAGSLSMVLDCFHVFAMLLKRSPKLQHVQKFAAGFSYALLSGVNWCSRKAPKIRSIFHTGDSSDCR